MFNKALLDIAAPVPKDIPVHDWCLCCVFFYAYGERVCLLVQQ
jgi:hypothetical protein